MDEGVIALVTAGVGLVGAISGAAIGGAAAARGARVGAETAARATVKQVSDQAAADHGHWLRDQRLEGYRALLVAYEAYTLAATAAQRSLERDERVDNSEREAVGSSAVAVMQAYFTIRLLGPEAVKDKALQLRLKIDEHVDSLSAWTNAVLRADEQAREETRTQANVLRRELARLHSEFLTAGTATLATADRPAISAN